MNLSITPVKTNKQLKAFVAFPYKLYKNSKMWVPPIKKDEEKLLKAEHNPCFDFCDVQLWIAVRDGKVVGRIGGIINHKYIEKTGIKTARFTRLEFIDDREIVSALLGTAEKWAKEQGMEKIDGPLGFTNLDHQAMLIEGFDHLPSIASEYHMDYYKAHIEALGYEKEMDWVEFRLTIPDSIIEKSIRVSSAVMKRNQLSIVNFEKTEELRKYGKQLFELMDLSFGELFSYVPFSEKMINFYVDKFIPLLHPRFVKVITDKDDNMVAFIVGMPSLSEAFQKAKGRLFPMGFWHILQAYKKPEVLDLLLTGIHPKAQGMGYAALLITELQKTAIENGVKFTETTGIIETNNKAIQTWKNFENIQHKRKRCFIKRLN